MTTASQLSVGIADVEPSDCHVWEAYTWASLNPS